LRVPRDLSGSELADLLKKYGYRVTRQTGSHLRLTTDQSGEHHVTIPRHDPLRLGTLAAIVSEVATHLGLSREEILGELFGGPRRR